MEHIIDTLSNLDGAQRYYGEWKKYEMVTQCMIPFI